MACADTNVLLRWAVDDVPEQTQAASKLLFGSEIVHVADPVIIEMVYVLEKLYGFDRIIVAGYVQAVLALSQVNCNRALFSRVLPLYILYSRISITDCCLAICSELDGTSPLYTFDKQLAKKLTAAKELT